MERQGHVSSASSSGRSGSRKRVRSKSPSEEFRKPKDTRVSRQLSRTNRPSLTAKTDNKDKKDQPKITNFKSKQTSKMASLDNGQNGEKKTLSEFESLVLEKLQNLGTKMEEIDKKLDIRIEKLESRVYDIEQVQDKCVKDIESIQRQQQLGEELILSNENMAKTSFDKSMSNEQYSRNFNIRIFNLEEHEKETIHECEQKVLKLFKEKLNVDVPIEAIDVLHRVGKKQYTNVAAAASNSETDTQTNVSKETTENIMDVGQSESLNTEDENESKSKSSPSKVKTGSSKKQGNSRPVIVSFLSRRVRREVLANRFRLKKKSDGEVPIILVEDLTKQNHALLSRAKDTEKFSSVWSKDGNIYAKQQNGMIVAINSFADIDAPPIERSFGGPRRSYTPVGQYTPKHYTRGGRSRGHYRRRGSDRFPAYGPQPYDDRGLTLQNKYDCLRESHLFEENVNNKNGEIEVD